MPALTPDQRLATQKRLMRAWQSRVFRRFVKRQFGTNIAKGGVEWHELDMRKVIDPCQR